MRTKLDAYDVAARLAAEKAGAQVIDGVDRKSFADVLTPLYSTLLPDPRLRAIVRQVQADVEIAGEP